jgi:hypothetical protein
VAAWTTLPLLGTIGFEIDFNKTITVNHGPPAAAALAALNGPFKTNQNYVDATYKVASAQNGAGVIGYNVDVSSGIFAASLVNGGIDDYVIYQLNGPNPITQIPTPANAVPYDVNSGANENGPTDRIFAVPVLPDGTYTFQYVSDTPFLSGSAGGVADLPTITVPQPDRRRR